MKHKNGYELKSFLETMNSDKDYIKGHDIGREMLLNGENRQLAKLFASLAGLAQQFEKDKMIGYKKFRKMVLKQMEEYPDHPFDENDFHLQLKQLDEVIEIRNNEDNHSTEKGNTYTNKLSLTIKLKDESHL